jgi:hypothetical protein
VYYESNHKGNSIGGYEFVSIFKLMCWLLKGKINPKENIGVYYIVKIETSTGKRI